MKRIRTKGIEDDQTPADTSKPTEDVEAKPEEESSSEPYGAQVLRRIYEHCEILMEEYDNHIKPLENEKVKEFVTGILEGLAEHMDTVEEIFEHEYEELGGIGGEADDKDATDEADSEEEELPSPEEAVEGMQKKAHKNGYFKTYPTKTTPAKNCKCSKCRMKRKGLGIEDGHEPGKEEGNIQAGNPGTKKKKDFPEMEHEDDVNEVTEGVGTDEGIKGSGGGLKSLQPHHKSHLADAHGFLKDLSESQELTHEHRLDAHLHHKQLADISDHMLGIEDGHVPHEEAGHEEDTNGVKQFPEVDKEDSEVEVTKKSGLGIENGHEPGKEEGNIQKKNPGTKSGLGIENGHEPGKEEGNIQKQNPGTKGKKDFPEVEREDETMEVTEGGDPKQKAVKDASDYLKEVAHTNEMTEETRQKAFYHHKSLFPIIDELNNVNVQEPASNTQEAVPGQMDEKALRNLFLEQQKQIQMLSKSLEKVTI
jgi:hypothetical protein